VVVTAPGENVDFVSRCFFPKLNVDEDPVTGSAHCELAPYWALKLAKNNLKAKQLSARTGLISCQLQGDRVLLTGKAEDYMRGKITL
jgi:predicted PhzF superfamily epimerase YddE/YHI9